MTTVTAKLTYMWGEYVHLTIYEPYSHLSKKWDDIQYSKFRENKHEIKSLKDELETLERSLEEANTALTLHVKTPFMQKILRITKYIQVKKYLEK